MEGQPLDPEEDIRKMLKLAVTLFIMTGVMLFVVLAGTWFFRPNLEELTGIVRNNCEVCLTNNSMTWEELTAETLSINLSVVREKCIMCFPANMREGQIVCYGGVCR